MKETINSDTYQTLKELKVDSKPFDKAIEPLWKNNSSKEEIKPYSIFVATPVHSECSIHYTQALLELQKIAFQKKIKIKFQLMKSSLVTQGRNLCVAGFLESDFTHMLFIDSDIYVQAESILKMIERDKDVISIPYPLKTMMWDKAMDRINDNQIKNIKDLKTALNTYPMRVADDHDIKVNKGVMEAVSYTHLTLPTNREV